MKKFPKTIVILLGAALLLAVTALFGATPGVRAADDKGTSEKLLDGIGKGLSGISKYFWSPGATLFGDGQASGKEASTASGTSKAQVPDSSPETDEGEPEMLTVTVTAPAEPQPQPQQQDEKTIVVQPEAPVAQAPQAMPQPEQPAVAETVSEAETKSAAEPAKTEPAVVPAESKAAATSPEPKAETPATTGEKRLASEQENKQIGAFASTGSYLWVPDKGSELERQYGMAAIPAETMKKEGQLARTDGRWIFVPAGVGERAGITGLEQKILEAPEGGNWIGEDNRWVYVFGKQQTYGGIGQSEETAKANDDEKQMQVASAEPQPQNKIENGVRLEPAQPKVQAEAPVLVPANEEKTAETEPEAKQQTAPAEENEEPADMHAAETEAASAPGDEAKVAEAAPTGGEAKPAPEEEAKVAGTMPRSGEDNGRWAKVGNHWAYVATETARETGVADTAETPAKETEQVPPLTPEAQVAAADTGKQAPTEPADKAGHWSMVNGRWVYSDQAPEPQAAPEPTKPQVEDEKTDVTAQPATKAQSNVSVQRSLPGVAVVEEGKPQPQLQPESQPEPAPANGLAEQVQQPQATVDQQQGAGVATSRSVSETEQKQAATEVQPQQDANAYAPEPGPILVFVPGQMPGTGRWYMAPANVMQQMQPVQQNPVFDGGR